MKLNCCLISFVLLFALVSDAANSSSKSLEREYDHPIDDVKQALQSLRADDTIRLPTLRGFVTDNLAIGTWERPYYQFETELVSRSSERTLLRVRARVTAWYTDSAHAAQEYRSLSSSGRLESEFLDRVGTYLIKIDSDPLARIGTLEKTLGDLISKTEALEKHRNELIAANKRMEADLQSQSERTDLRKVLRSGVSVLDRPSTSAHAVFSVERDDVFEIADERPGWVQVKLANDSTGWLPATATKSVSGSADQGMVQAALKQKPSPFVVTREAVTPFLGDWPSLRGKKALFMWAQPVGVAHREVKETLGYVKQLFADRYRDALHSDVDYTGLVIIFVGAGNKTGVAAARLDDIGQWINGHMPDSEFLKRCSLDPPELFRSVRN